MHGDVVHGGVFCIMSILIWLEDSSCLPRGIKPNSQDLLPGCVGTTNATLSSLIFVSGIQSVKTEGPQDTIYCLFVILSPLKGDNIEKKGRCGVHILFKEI